MEILAVIFGMVIFILFCLLAASGDLLEKEKKQTDSKIQSATKELNDKIVSLFEENSRLQYFNQSAVKDMAALELQRQELLASIPRLIEKERKQAVDSSRAVLKGKVSEQLAPFLNNFPYKSSDLRFLGSPIDFICFDGMSDGKIKSVKLIDIKTGEASLTERQRQIRESVENCQLDFEVFKI